MAIRIVIDSITFDAGDLTTFMPTYNFRATYFDTDNMKIGTISGASQGSFDVLGNQRPGIKDDLGTNILRSLLWQMICDAVNLDNGTPGKATISDILK